VGLPRARGSGSHPAGAQASAYPGCLRIFAGRPVCDASSRSGDAERSARHCVRVWIPKRDDSRGTLPPLRFAQSARQRDLTDAVTAERGPLAQRLRRGRRCLRRSRGCRPRDSTAPGL
jgi:hypothetical protein